MKKALIILIALLVASVALNIYQCVGKSDKLRTDTITRIDTIPYIKPICKDSTRDRVIYRYLVFKRTDTTTRSDTTLLRDSVLVSVPITSYHYQDTSYSAWVSGYEARLDSIKVYQRHTIITREEITKPKKWGVGVQLGIGYYGKFTPYVGIGISYNILNF